MGISMGAMSGEKTGTVFSTASGQADHRAADMPCHGVSDQVADLAHAAPGDVSLHEAGHGGSASAHCHPLCDVCNGPAMMVTLSVFAPNVEPPRLVPPARERFSSQPLRSDVRPPIA